MNVERQNRGDLLLQKWLNGNITWQEERELEQLAKGDAMLADALEGVRVLPESDHFKQVENLKIRLQQRTGQQQRGLIFYLPRIAAVAAVAMGVTLGIRYLGEHFFNHQDSEVVVNQPKSAKSLDSAKTSIAIEEKHTNATFAFEDKKTIRPTPKITTPDIQTFDNRSVAVQKDTVLTIAEADAPLVESEKPGVESTRMERAKTYEEPRANQKPDVARSISPNNNFPGGRVIKGKVTDAAGEPLIGAAVLVEGANQGTVSDVKGNFEILVPSGKDVLTISYTGFVTQAIQIKEKDTINLQLQVNAQTLSEVVVSGYGSNKRESNKKDAQLQGKTQDVQATSLPMPRGGFEKLERYIQKNLQYPTPAKDANVGGKVRVAFVIKANGSLSDFKIVESLGYGCDEEAIRLLKAGPKWEMRNKVLQGDTATYMVEFKLK